MAATIKAPVIFTAKDRVSPTMARMSRSVKGFSNRASVGIARVEHRFNRLMTPIHRVGRMLGDFGILAGGFLAYQVFNDISNFETGMVGVSKTTGIVGDDLDSLGKDFVDLSNEMRGVSAQSLVEVGQTAGQLGVKGSENILKFSKVMAQLESATDVAGEEGASKIARLLTNTGEGVGVIDRFASALTGLGNNAAATEDEILSVASEVARGTSAYKLQSKEILGLSATLKSLDVRPEAAGTAIGQTFRAIEMATLNGGQELQNFADIMGQTSQQVIEDFEKNPRVAFDKFIKGLNKISNEGGSVAKTMEKVGLTSAGLSKTIIPLAGDYENLAKNQALSSNEFQRNLAVQEEFDASTRTISTALKDVQKSFTNMTLKTATAGSKLEKLRTVLYWVSDNMETIVVIGASLIGTWLAIKTALIVAKIALAAYNVVLGITTALTQANKRALIGNTVATYAYKAAMIVVSVATKAWTAAQWLINAALYANPVGLVIAAIAALVGLVTLIIAKYNDWGAALSLILGPFGMIINVIQSFRRNWEMVKDAFKNGGIMEGLKAIGRVLIDALLMPLQQLLELASNIPGLGNIAGGAAKGIAAMRENLGVNTGGGEEKVLPSTNQASSQQTTNTIRDSRVNIDVRDKGGNVEKVEQDGNEIPLMMRNTAGAF